MNNLINTASAAIDQLIEERKIIDAVLLIFYDAMGPSIFWGIVLMTMFGVAYINTQLILPVILLAFLLFATIAPNIPIQAMQFGLAIIALGIGSILYILFVKRRTQ